MRMAYDSPRGRRRQVGVRHVGARRQAAPGTMKVRALAARLASTVELLLERPGALGAMLRWPYFSLTSYRMVDDLRRQGVRPRTVIDVGANVGQFALAALELWAPTSLHAFEPVEKAHQV